MVGGAKSHILDILEKHSNIMNLYVVSGLIIAITFVKEVPISIRGHAGGLLGRTLLFFATLFIADQYSWVSGLLMAILTLLLLSLGPRTVAEGFQSPYDTNIKLITDKEKWFVEKVFHENPIGIQEDKVRTKAIQDGYNGSSSTTGQGGSK
jgi:hypothetical protein